MDKREIINDLIEETLSNLLNPNLVTKNTYASECIYYDGLQVNGAVNEHFIMVEFKTHHALAAKILEERIAVYYKRDRFQRCEL